MNIENLEQSTLEQIEYWDMLIKTFDGISRALMSRDRTEEDLPKALVIVRKALVSKELTAYRNYFMWVAIGDNKEARQVALERFLADDMEVMQYTTIDGKMLAQHLGKDEEEIRNLIERMKQEIDNEHEREE